MNIHYETVVPDGILIREAVGLAKSGDRMGALAILDGLERKVLAEKRRSNGSALKVIDFIRQRYELSKNNEYTLPLSNGQTSVGYGVEETLPGVSLISCCRNREENLLKALPTWLAHPKIREIIIVDWTSDTPIKHVFEKNRVNDSRIKVVRVENEPRWVLSYAFNLGFRFARHEYVLKVDADITLKSDFFEKNVLDERMFIAGDWEKAEKGQEHINGFFYVRTKDLLAVKGFNEFITTYGWDDDDLYFRLQNSGLSRNCVDVKSIYHIPHDDTLRLDGIGKESRSAWTEFRGDTLYKIRTNRYIATVMPSWNKDRLLAPFAIVKDSPHEVTVDRCKSEMPHLVSSTMQRQAETYAAMEILSWNHGPSVFHVESEDFHELLSIKKLSQISQFDINLLLGGFSRQKIRPHNLYVDFDGWRGNDDLDYFSDLLLELVSDGDVALITSPSVPVNVVRRLGAHATKIKHTVGTRGLCTIDSSNVSELRSLVRKGAGCHVKVSSDLLSLVSLGKSSSIRVAQRRRLYIDTQHGLGNRLRAYASAAAIARASNRELVVVWVPDVHCQCRFRELFEYEGQVIESYEALPVELHRYNYMELEPDAIKDAEICFDNNRDVLVRSAFVLNHEASNWESENVEIRALRPSSQVLKLVDSVKLPADFVGVHVRMEAGKGLDNNAYDSEQNWSVRSHELIHHWREKSHFSVFIKRMDSLVAENVACKFFLATDLPENYDVLSKTFGDRLVFLPRTVFDRSSEQIVFALADAILLSKATRFMGSTWSSFSELALRLTTTIKTIEMSGVDF